MKKLGVMLALAETFGIAEMQRKKERKIEENSAKERLLAEYKLIQAKKSKAPARLRKEIVQYVENQGWHK